jgi:hypothetical protein
MNADSKTAAYYVGVSQHAFDVPAPSTLVTGVALAYAIVALGLAAQLVFFSGTPGRAAQDPAVSQVASPAIDPEALTAGLRLDDNSDTGSGYLEFAPPPAEAQGTPTQTIGHTHAAAGE